MLEKITEEELNFLECWFYPIANAECLFSDFDNLSEFDESRLGEMRLYQYPMLSYEAIVDDITPKVTAKTKFKWHKMLGDGFNFGARKYGKCEKSDSLCLLSDGTYHPYSELVNTERSVFCLDENTQKITSALARFANNGVKECFRVELKTGKYIEITSNHPLLTNYGWKTVEELIFNKEVLIATPNCIPCCGIIEPSKNLAKLLGYLLGDGGTSIPNAVSFTNINAEIIKEYHEIADYFNCKVRFDGDCGYHVSKKDYQKSGYEKGVGIIRGEGHKLNVISEIVIKYGIDKLAKNKTIPEEIFSWKNEYIAILLNRLFACDGHINKLSRQIEIVLASKKMIYQISSLLLRFGIRGRIYYKPVILKGKKFDSWRYTISQDFNKFLDIVGIKSKDDGFRINSTYSTGDVIPNNYYYKIHPTLPNKKKYRLNSFKNYHPSKEKLSRLNKIFKNADIDKLLNSDIYWDKIKSIISIGLHPTVIVEVNNHHNYISNDIFSHNSLICLKLDIPLSLLYDDKCWCGMTSTDAIHIDGILDSVKDAAENHPILKYWKKQIHKTPKWSFIGKNGWLLDGVNMNILSKNPGHQFYGKHFRKLFGEEMSHENDKVFEKRKDALSELGAVFRFSGMTNFTRHSPAGKVFYDPKNKVHVINYPQFVNPTFDEDEKQERIKQYGGMDSIGFKVFVRGKVVEDGVSSFDMERVSRCYNEDQEIKRFEIPKDKFSTYDTRIIVERPKNATNVYVVGDVGDGSGGSEILVISESGEKYNYLYNITLYNLTHSQQEEIFKWIIGQVQANIIAIDCGDALGRTLCDGLEKCYGKERVVRYAGTSKVKIDFEKDDKGNVLMKDGQPVYREEFESEFAVHRLKHLLYEGKINIPLDFKFDAQFSSVMSLQLSNRTVYKCVSERDHLFDAFRVFAIAEWIKKSFVSQPIKNQNWGTGACNWKRPPRKEE